MENASLRTMVQASVIVPVVTKEISAAVPYVLQHTHNAL